MSKIIIVLILILFNLTIQTNDIVTQNSSNINRDSSTSVEEIDEENEDSKDSEEIFDDYIGIFCTKQEEFFEKNPNKLKINDFSKLFLKGQDHQVESSYFSRQIKWDKGFVTMKRNRYVINDKNHRAYHAVKLIQNNVEFSKKFSEVSKMDIDSTDLNLENKNPNFLKFHDCFFNRNRYKDLNFFLIFEPLKENLKKDVEKFKTITNAQRYTHYLKLFEDVQIFHSPKILTKDEKEDLEYETPTTKPYKGAAHLKIKPCTIFASSPMDNKNNFTLKLTNYEEMSEIDSKLESESESDEFSPKIEKIKFDFFKNPQYYSKNDLNPVPQRDIYSLLLTIAYIEYGEERIHDGLYDNYYYCFVACENFDFQEDDMKKFYLQCGFKQGCIEGLAVSVYNAFLDENRNTVERFFKKIGRGKTSNLVEAKSYFGEKYCQDLICFLISNFKVDNSDYLSIVELKSQLKYLIMKEQRLII